MAATVDAILDEISQLSIEDQEMLDEIVHKRIIEGKREEIRAAYLAAVEERKQGKTMSGSVDDILVQLTRDPLGVVNPLGRVHLSGAISGGK